MGLKSEMLNINQGQCQYAVSSLLSFVLSVVNTGNPLD